MKKTIDPVETLEQDESAQKVAAQKAMALDAAAGLLLAMLSEPVRLILTETAETTLSIPLWQLIAGLVQQSYDIGLYVTPILDPDWSRNLPAKPMVYSQAKCEQCGEDFVPRWPKQRFCSNECGIDHQRRLSAGRARSHVVGGEYPMGQEPGDRPTSALHPPASEGVG